MFTKQLSWIFVDIVSTSVVRIFYAIWVVLPVIIILNIINLKYKVPFYISIIICLLRIIFWVYSGTQKKIVTLEIVNEKIQEDMDIVFISDLHINIFQNKNYIKNIVKKISTINPDLILIWWDIVDSPEKHYKKAFLEFNNIDIPIFATLGNHDNFWEKDIILDLLKNIKITTLRNEQINFKNIWIIGIDDKSYRLWKNLDDILGEIEIKNNWKFNILISHQPQHLTKIKDYYIDLQLAGHTHKGQFVPISWIVWIFNDYKYGKYILENQTAFVSQWVWNRWAPIRVWTSSEIVLIKLRKE